MTFLSKVLKQLKREGLGPDECLICLQPATTDKLFGFPWCEDHEHHGKVLTWGHWHKFPELHFGHYAIGSGDDAWWFAVSLGNEDFLWTALAYIEYLDSLEKTA